MNRRIILFVLLLAALALAGCSAAGTTPTANAPSAPPSKQPQKPPPPKPTQPAAPPAASPTPAQGNTSGECTLTALGDVTVYDRPSAQAQPFGVMAKGTTILPEYRTPDGWYGFDPGVAQAGNVGIFRMRWAFADQNVQVSGNCEQLPLAPPLPAAVCFLMPMTTINVYARPQTNAPVVGTLTPEEYAAVVGRTADGWVRLNLNLGQNNLSGKGWATLDDAGLNGATCDDLPEISGGGAPPSQPPTATPSASNGNSSNANSNEVRIQFAAGAIQWQAPVAPQASYVFGAAQGQSTEILVLQNGQPANAALALAAPDGQPLQTYNVGRPDWRGVLPQNGDYHLSIAAPNSVSGMTLVVTIYPLPAEAHPITDTGVGYTLTYDGAYFHPQQAGFFPNEVFSLNLAYDDFFAHTNLSEAYFIMGLEPINDADTCLNTPPEASITDAVDTWRINGVDYRHYTSEDAGAGNIYAADIFRTYVHSRCITVYLFTHSTNINNYDPSAGIHPYDAAAVMDQFKRVFFTLQWP